MNRQISLDIDRRPLGDRIVGRVEVALVGRDAERVGDDARRAGVHEERDGERDALAAAQVAQVAKEALF